MHREQEVDERIGESITLVGNIFGVHLWQIFSTRLSNKHTHLEVQF